MSLSASGSVAGTLTYATWKGRPYVRQLVTPSNPKSGPQKYTRAMMSFLASVWRSLDGATQATWQDLASQGNYSPFNAFVSFNMRRWTQQQGPTTEPDFSGPATADTVGLIEYAGGVRQIGVSITLTVKAGSWGYGIALDQLSSSPVPMMSVLLIVPSFSATTGDTITGLISGLTPGTYEASAYQLRQSGDISAGTTAITSIVVT
jgi:hypothetical protein